MADELVKLLPRGSGTFPKAVVRAAAEYQDPKIKEFFNPDTTPVAHLSYLAEHLGVQLWYEDWTEERKREMLKEWPKLASIKGTRKCLKRLLYYVDAEMIDVLGYPQRFVIGRDYLGRKPIHQDAFTAHYLIKVKLKRPKNAMIIGRSALGKSSLARIDRTPIERAERAAVVSKTPESQYTLNFGWRRKITFGDDVPFDGSYAFGSYVDRERIL